MIGSRFDIGHGNQSSIPLGEVEKSALHELKKAITDKKLTFSYHDCPICGQREMETLANRDRYGVPCTTALCSACGLMQTQPYLDNNSLTLFYQQYFTRLHRGSDGPTDEKFQSRRQYGAELSSWLREHCDVDSGTIVDVGCGSGGIVQGFQDSGFSAIGADMDPEYIAFGKDKGLDLRLGTLSDIELPKSATLITYVQVLEHIVDINGEISRLAKVMPKQARLFIEVPGLTSLPTQYSYDFLHLLQLAHVWLFSPTTLSKLFASHGFVAEHLDDHVRAIFRYDPDAARDRETPHETVEDIKSLIRRFERIRPLYWRYWARAIKAKLKAL